jgi:SAM-dependent MidA family methyltransferase
LEPLHRFITRIRRDGPMTFDTFMDLALYDPQDGYYARESRRSGRQRDYVTSVDVGPLFGELLARQFVEMHALLGSTGFDLVEAAASTGQLSRDVLDAMAREAPATCDSVRLHLVERSDAARELQRDVLGGHAGKLASASPDLPDAVTGVIYANELLDALPCHAVVMTGRGLREIVVDVDGDELVEREAPLSSPAIAHYFDALGITLGLGWRAEVNLRAVNWTRDAARRLRRGFLLLIDYGHRAAELYSASHSAGTRISYDRHVAESAGERPAWLTRPGEVDITAHVDLTSIERAAHTEGLTTIAMLDQTYFLLALGVEEMLARGSSASPADLKRRLALKTLLLPGGLGSTLKVMIFARGVGTPSLRGCSQGVRLT